MSENTNQLMIFTLLATGVAFGAPLLGEGLVMPAYELGWHSAAAVAGWFGL